MQKSKSQKVKIQSLKGKNQKLKKSHNQTRLKKYQCSDYLASKSLLAEGEFCNTSSKNPMVVITDLSTGKFKGCSRLSTL